MQSIPTDPPSSSRRDPMAHSSPTSRFARRARAASASCLLACCTLLVPPAPTSAQSVAPGDVDMGAIERRIEMIRPKSGPPGTVVHVSTADMPVITPIRVGIGAPQAGFEAFEELLTGQEGEFEVTVAVPEWASWDRVHLFIVFDIYFRPIALSDAFHVTNEDGLVRRSGHVRDGPGGCRILRDIDGVDYALTGEGAAALAEVRADRRVTVDARLGTRPSCGLQNVLEVVAVSEST